MEPPTIERMDIRLATALTRVVELETKLAQREACDRAFNDDHRRVMNERDVAQSEANGWERRYNRLLTEK